MNVWTKNSIFQVLGTGDQIEVKRIADLINQVDVPMDVSYFGTRLVLEIGRPLKLEEGGKEVYTTSTIMKIEG